jgi:EAL domain-containing protein (putative c-di-GMP-specific phosphodiesterase class I)
MPVTMSLETSWFEEALASNAYSVWFQPVIDTTTRRIIGHECLIRLTTGYRREGAEIMAAASARRDISAFDAYTRQLAMRAVSSQPDSGAATFVNFIPSAIGEPSELLTEPAARPANIVMEATGCNSGPDIVHLRRIGDYLHKQGLRLCLDDVSANAEALRLICDVRPDYIKLDRPGRQTTAVRRLVEVAERLNVCVIAKGVERVSTMEQLWDAGVHCMQGYLFGCPSPEMSPGTSDTSRGLPLELLDGHYASPVLANLNKEFLCALGIP